MNIVRSAYINSWLAFGPPRPKVPILWAAYILQPFLQRARNIYSVSKTLIGLARNETNDELLFPRLDFFFPRPKGGQLFSRGRRPRLNRPTGGQGKKRSPTKETKSSSKVSVSSTAAKYHVLEDRYIFLLNYHMSNQAILNG